MAPWEKEAQQETSNNHCEETEEDLSSDKNESPPVKKPADESRQSSQNATEAPRKPGRQLGSKGFGRTQKLTITHYQEHFSQKCECCQHPLNTTIKKATTAFETLDLEWADEKSPGIRLTNTKHTYYEISCHCGHVTVKEPHRSNSLDTLQDITCSQWRLVGPGLASLIICLTYRMRLSRERVQEFLWD